VFFGYMDWGFFSFSDLWSEWIGTQTLIVCIYLERNLEAVSAVSVFENEGLVYSSRI